MANDVHHDADVGTVEDTDVRGLVGVDAMCVAAKAAGIVTASFENITR